MLKTLGVLTLSPPPHGIRFMGASWKHRIIAFLAFCSLLGMGGCNRQERFESYPVLYDFVENFHLADVQQEFRLVDIGTPAVRRFLISGWSRDEKCGSGTGNRTRVSRLRI